MQHSGPETGHLVARRPPKWLWLVPLLSIGVLALVPTLAIAAKARTRQAWSWAIGLAAAWILGFMLLGTGDPDGAVSTVGFGFYLFAFIGAIVFALVMGPTVTWSERIVRVSSAPPPPPPPRPYDPNEAAVAGVQSVRRKREDARELARRDPAMARDLRIGRPDLPRDYDDGGLIDVNSAPPDVMARHLGLSPEEAERIAAARRELGLFEHVEDLISYASIEQRTFDRVREVVILL